LPRAAGHRAGVEALRATVRTAPGLGVEWLTLYAFSSENWSRPQSEVSDLMGLLKLFIKRDLAELHKAGVRVRIIGAREGLEPDILALLTEAEMLTAGNVALNLNIAFNYGGRDEIVRAARRLAEAVQRGDIAASAITAEVFAEALDTAGMPDPDLVIRTSGEMRLSNFLLWQSAYSELVFLPCYWPDFGAQHFEEAIRMFAERDRRFGGRKAGGLAS
jgi:undecaprenyl diphosphate synthase